MQLIIASKRILKACFHLLAAGVSVYIASSLFFFFNPDFGEPSVLSAEQSIPLPGAQIIECRSKGRYQVYFKGTKHTVDKIETDGTKHKSISKERNKIVYELAQDPSSVRTRIICQVKENSSGSIIPLDYSERILNQSSSRDDCILISHCAFVPPKPGLYTFSCKMLGTSAKLCFMTVLPPSWDLLPPLRPVCAARLIQKGSVITEADITDSKPFYKGGMLGPNNLVKDASHAIGYRTNRFIWPGNDIHYSDLDQSPNDSKITDTDKE